MYMYNFDLSLPPKNKMKDPHTIWQVSVNRGDYMEVRCRMSDMFRLSPSGDAEDPYKDYYWEYQIWFTNDFYTSLLHEGHLQGLFDSRPSLTQFLVDFQSNLSTYCLYMARHAKEYDTFNQLVKGD